MYDFINLLGGISLFLYGLTLVAGSTKSLTEGKNGKIVSGLCKRPIGGLLTGTVVSAITQSSVAVNFIAVEMVQERVLNFYSAAAVIMGANIGTTATAQLISAVGLKSGVIGSIVAIIGLLLGFFKNKSIKNLSGATFGLGVLFAGFSQMQLGAKGLASYGWFTKLLLVKNPFALFLVGMLFTAITQSSSALTGLIVVLANCKLLDFSSAAYLTLGSNVGSCFSVVLLSLGKKVEARQTAVFNLAFNLLGSALIFPLVYFFGDGLTLLLASGKTVGKAIADFHTLFNLTCALIFLPFLKVFTLAIKRLVKDKQPSAQNQVVKGKGIIQY